MSAQPLPDPDPHDELDQALAELASSGRRWLGLPLGRKTEYLRGLLDGIRRTAVGQVEAACAAKGVPFDSPLAGEDWIGGPYIVGRTVRLLMDSLEALRATGEISIPPSRIRTGPGGRAIVQVFPLDTFDRLLYRGYRAEVWMQPHVTPDTLRDHMGGVYRQSEPQAGVSLVLGAGNVASIAPLDVVHKLFYEGRVALLKLNPVNDYLRPLLEDAFRDLVRDGFVRIVTGGGEVGSYLCHHDLVDDVHITGSAATHDLIVWGSGADAEGRRAEGRPLLDKPITSELGNVSPVLVVPGRWSQSDLDFHAENVATQMVQNGGFNCNAAKVLVLARSWPQREAFLEALRRTLRSVPRRPAYYPGAGERWQRFVDAYPHAEILGENTGDRILPPVLLTDLDPADTGQLAFREESFCTVTAETALEATGPAAFLEHAVDWVNDSLTGTLNATILVDPRTRRGLGTSFESALDRLRYGAVGINQWAAAAFALGSTPWGAYPGHTLKDIQSGIGTVHNTFLFDAPEKSVVDAPFRVTPKPPWFVTHSGAAGVGRRLAAFEPDPSYARLPGIVLAALRG